MGGDVEDMEERARMLDLKAVARELGVSVDCVRRRVREGKLRAKDVGHGGGKPRWRVRREWLEAYVDSEATRDGTIS